MDNNNSGTNIMDSMVNAQKEFMDTVVSNTRKLTNGNTLVNETLDKGSEWYKNWLEAQKATLNNVTEKAAEATEQVKSSATDTQTFFQNWMSQQTAWARQLWEMNSNMMKNMQSQQATAASNPMEWWKQMANNWTAQATGANPWMNWMNNAQINNMWNMDAWKNAMPNWNEMMAQWNNMATAMMTNFSDTFKNGTVTDAYRNMLNSTEGFSRFAAMMAPMWEAIQNNTFTKDMFNNLMNPSAYQELLDKYFGFIPAEARTYFQQYTQAMQTWMKQNGGMLNDQYRQMRSAMQNMMPAGMAHNGFAQMLSAYETGWNQLQEAVSPIVRMMTPNAQTKSMLEWSDLLNRMVVFSMKNAELQYLMYAQGGKVMDELADYIIQKQQNGEEIKSLMSLYQDWLNISDKSYVSLFESDEYSQLMAEVSALQMKLRKDMEHQMEAAMSNIPVATRSELDELYKTIYDLKKQVRQLEKMMEFDGDDTTTEPAPAPKAKTTKK